MLIYSFGISYWWYLPPTELHDIDLATGLSTTFFNFLKLTSAPFENKVGGKEGLSAFHKNEIIKLLFLWTLCFHAALLGFEIWQIIYYPCEIVSKF